MFDINVPNFVTMQFYSKKPRVLSYLSKSDSCLKINSFIKTTPKLTKTKIIYIKLILWMKGLRGVVS